ncbi:uncharacterized protein THITE_48227 [Thermothielavioides terrestris NRRL 8126]|uniref:Uncharacterized protein n=1 Tax=Thermothielavioides terrestris (strain ATCC 38088 / NRRL 8126) TaxID=578455 RepID=G2QVD0_THETT|nr:uncharacterized protein THITE_48227 [Thermothielavioides terrestris NRRL 8126]AEO63817.1 hypothetical protein THITE_48227 [Thermothielavioides terrestris NRRL 8126]
MQYHHDFQHPSPLVIPPRILDLLHRAVDLFADQSGADDESDGPRQSLGPVLVPPWRERLGVPVSNTSVVPIRPDPHQNNSLSLVGGANSGDDSPRLPLYYSKNKNNRRRDKNSHSETRSGSHGYYSRSFSSDRATAHAIKSARYPVLYEKLKAPAAARRALKTWRKEGEQGAAQEAASNALALDNQVRPAIGDGQTTSSELPPQHMTFSEPLLENKKRGRRLRITCTLEKSYPNFHIECEYTYIDESERVNGSRIDTRISCAVISTRENVWVVTFEQRGYNERFIKGFVGEAEYARLDGEISGPIKGYGKSSDLSTVKMAKKIRIPEGYDLGGIWCEAAGFYEMRIYVPAKDYVQEDDYVQEYDLPVTI